MYTYWKDGDTWIGYLHDYPDYMTQGETLKELKENLRDIYQELISGTIAQLSHADFQSLLDQIHRNNRHPLINFGRPRGGELL